jgi:hypothetical protein
MTMKAKTMALAVREALGGYAARFGLVMGALAMALEKAEHAKLPEAQRGLYVEKDGKFALDVEGVEDTAGLKSALEKERKAAREADRIRKELEKKFEGIDPDEVKKILEKMGSDEERQLLKDGKIDQVVEKRMEKQRLALEKQIREAQKERDAEREGKAKLVQRGLDERVRAAAAKAGLHANAVEDALFRARTIFTLNAEGEAVQLDKDGAAVIGKDGKTAFGPAEWLEGMRETAPHWYPAANTGSGAAGNKGATGAGKTMKRAAFDALDPAQKREFAVVEKGTVVD